jgi:uncharacterized membrane protein
VECPSCRAGFDEDAERCPRCGTILVSGAVSRSSRRPALLANLTLAAIIAATLIFAIRAVGTFWIARQLETVRVTTFVYLVAHVVILLFLVAFHRDYASRRGSNLAGATTVLICACAGATLVVALNLLRTIGLTVMARETTAAVSTVMSLLVAFAAVMFFTGLCNEVNDAGGRLARAVRLAVAGSLVSAVAHAGVFALYATRLMRPELVPLTSPVLRAASIVVSSFVFATLLGFLMAFYGERRRHLNHRAT